MKFQLEQATQVLCTNSNPRTELHGEERVRAIKQGRRAAGSELNAAYFADQVHYLQAAEREVSMPSLFDLEDLKEAA